MAAPSSTARVFWILCPPSSKATTRAPGTAAASSSATSVSIGQEEPAQSGHAQAVADPGERPRGRAQAAMQAQGEARDEDETAHPRGVIRGQHQRRPSAHRVSQEGEALDPQRIGESEDHARAAAQGPDRVRDGRASSKAGKIDAQDAQRGQELRGQVAEVAARPRDSVEGDQGGRVGRTLVRVGDDAVRESGLPRLRVTGREGRGVRAQRLGLSDAISSLAAARSRCAKPANCWPENSASAPSMVTRSPVWYGLASLMR